RGAPERSWSFRPPAYYLLRCSSTTPRWVERRVAVGSGPGALFVKVTSARARGRGGYAARAAATRRRRVSTRAPSHAAGSEPGERTALRGGCAGTGGCQPPNGGRPSRTRGRSGSRQTLPTRVAITVCVYHLGDHRETVRAALTGDLDVAP